MGNYISCTLAVSHPGTGTKIILPNSDIRLIGKGVHTAAAELMLDFPGHFVVNSLSLKIGARFSPLLADEELEPCNVYLMLPMHRVNSVVNASDVGPLIVAAGKAARKVGKGGARVLPEVSVRQVESPPRVVMEVDDEVRCRLSMCRSRRPMLETISEEAMVC